MTEFKPGDRVRVAFDLELDADCEVRLDLSGYWPVWQLAERTGVHVTRLTAEPAVSYADPHEGDEVEVTVRGTLFPRRADGDWVLQYDGIEDYGRVRDNVFRDAMADGRVRLVKAATPQYQPGRIYRSESTGKVFRRRGDQVVPEYAWQEVSDAGPLLVEADVPADLVLMDLVPAEVKP